MGKRGITGWEARAPATGSFIFLPKDFIDSQCDTPNIMMYQREAGAMVNLAHNNKSMYYSLWIG